MKNVSMADVEPRAARRGARPARRRAFTIVEILIAALVMAAVVVPLLVLLTQERTDELSDKGLLEAVSVASNIMEQLLAPALPFKALDCAPSYTSGYTKTQTNVQQAGFATSVQAQYEPILTDADSLSGAADPFFGGTTRVKKKGGIAYYVYFYAGKYPDDAPVNDTHEQSQSFGTGATRADIDNTLAFVYIENPVRFGLPWELSSGLKDETCKEIVLGSGGTIPAPPTPMTQQELLPYQLKPYTIGEGLTPTLTAKAPTDAYYHTDPSNFRLIPGWPLPRTDLGMDAGDDINATQQRAKWMKAVHDVVTSTNGAQPLVQYHPRAVDQRTFKATGGAYMKLVVGVKFFAYEQSMVGKARGMTAQNAREFWLVSFKADLESS